MLKKIQEPRHQSYVGVLNAGMIIMSMTFQYQMNIVENLNSLFWAITTFGVIYLAYYVLTINSYNKIVNNKV